MSVVNLVGDWFALVSRITLYVFSIVVLWSSWRLLRDLRKHRKEDAGHEW